MTFVAVALSVLAQLTPVESLTPPPAPPLRPIQSGSPVAQGAEWVGHQVRVELGDGNVLKGTLEARDAEGLTLRLRTGTQVRLSNADISNLVDVDEGDEPAPSPPSATPAPSASAWFEDVNRSRYFYSPSAMMMKKGSLSFSQKELALSLLSYGATDFLSLQLGSAFPAFFAGVNGLNLLMAVKVGGSVTPWFHLAGGIQSLIFPGFPGAFAATGLPLFGVGFGTVTLGDGNRHASVSVGIPFSIAGFGSSPTGPPLFTLSGNWRLTQTLALVTEHWLVVDVSGRGDYGLINGLGVRFMGQRLAVDVGVITISEVRRSGFTFVVPFPVPWLDVTYTFF